MIQRYNEEYLVYGLIPLIEDDLGKWVKYEDIELILLKVKEQSKRIEVLEDRVQRTIFYIINTNDKSTNNGRKWLRTEGIY